MINDVCFSILPEPIGFNMEMEIPFPFCVPVAAGIVSVSWEIL